MDTVAADTAVITKEEFERIWQESPTIDDFCAGTGFDRRDASNIAANLRKRHKIPLKNMPRNKSRNRFEVKPRPVRKSPVMDYGAIWNWDGTPGNVCVTAAAGCYCVIEIGEGLKRRLLGTFEREEDAERFARGEPLAEPEFDEDDD